MSRVNIGYVRTTVSTAADTQYESSRALARCKEDLDDLRRSRVHTAQHHLDHRSRPHDHRRHPPAHHRGLSYDYGHGPRRGRAAADLEEPVEPLLPAERSRFMLFAKEAP